MLKNKVWWKVTVLNNFLELGSEHASCFNVGTSSPSNNFYAMNLQALLEPCKPSFASSEFLVSTFFLLNLIKKTSSLRSNSTVSE